MEKKIRIKAGKVEALAQLNDSAIAGLVWDALPISASVSTWGDEIYFEIPVKANLTKPQDVVGLGDIGYWPSGRCFCIFFGPTPVSSGGEIRPASSVEIIGKVSTEPLEFKKVREGAEILLEKA
jgi:uncharacterized protein